MLNDPDAYIGIRFQKCFFTKDEIIDLMYYTQKLLTPTYIVGSSN